MADLTPEARAKFEQANARAWDYAGPAIVAALEGLALEIANLRDVMASIGTYKIRNQFTTGGRSFPGQIERNDDAD